MIKNGLVHYYFGTGKGKTTAAIGLALRVLGHGGRVACYCFMKSSNRYGEFRAAEKFGDAFAITLAGPPCANPDSGRPDFICDGCMSCHVEPGNPKPEDIAAAEKGLADAATAMSSGDFDLVILDEIGYAAAFGLLDGGAAVDAIKARADNVEVVITSGREKVPRFEKIAGYVTEMKELSHHYKTGRVEVQGIDY